VKAELIPPSSSSVPLCDGREIVKPVVAHRSAVTSILRLCVFFLLFDVLAIGTQRLIEFGWRKIPTSSAGALNRAMAGKVNAQIIISGSSRALVQYDPRIIQAFTGKTAYNIARNGSHIDMQLALLKAYLRHNRKPELVVQNLDLHSFVPTHELYDQAQYVAYLSDPDLSQAISRITPEFWKWRYVPLYAYVVEDMRLTWLVGVRGALGIYPREDHFLGYNPRDANWTSDFERFKAQNIDGYKVAIEDEGRRALKELIQLCAQRGIRLVLVY